MNALKHVVADALDLKISIQVDNALKENLENFDFAHGTLLSLPELSTLFPCPHFFQKRPRKDSCTLSYRHMIQPRKVRFHLLAFESCV